MSKKRGALGLIRHVNKRTINFQTSDETKEKDFELVGQRIVGR